MLIKKLGEFGLIERIRGRINTDASVIKGIGDDCAVMKFDRARYLLFTSDMIAEGADFTGKDSPYLIGRKALAVCLSDIAACGGSPRYATVSMGLPGNSTVKLTDGIYRGINALAGEYGVNIVGGDISRAGRLTLDVSMIGFVEKKCLALRSGAGPGDIIFVTGEFGGSISGKHLRFTPRVKESRFLVRNFRVNSMIDVSDGLIQDLGHILEGSGSGAVIYEDLIPLSRKARDLDDALYSGEDFELLFTMSPREARRMGFTRLVSFKPVGEIVDKKYKLRLIDKRGREKIIQPRGFRHF